MTESIASEIETPQGAETPAVDTAGDHGFGLK